VLRLAQLGRGRLVAKGKARGEAGWLPRAKGWVVDKGKARGRGWVVAKGKARGETGCSKPGERLGGC
jgi:hypothetical protein